MADQLEAPKSAGVEVPPPLLYLAVFGGGLVLQRFLPLPAVPSALAQPLGWLLLTTGCVVVGCGIAGLIVRRANPLPYAATNVLVCGGIFRVTRNPIYLGGLIGYLGVALLVACTWAILLTPLAVALMNRLVIRGEEEYLEQRFGEAYRSYAARVRRWI